MKTYKLLTLVMLLAFILSACGDATATPSNEVVLEKVYTSIAMTLSAQAALATATPTPQPSATSTPQPTATLVPTTAPTQKLPAPAAVISSGTTCDNSAYVSDVTIPDGTILAPGESFIKTWKLQNTGTCTWTTSYGIAYASGNSMSGSTTALSTSVDPSGTLNVSVEMVAPTTTGTYTGYWRLQNASGTSFGASVWVQIVVSDDASTLTPTPTATTEDDYTATPTSTDEEVNPTSTVTLTATFAPTSTVQPTATSASTDTPEPTAVPTETPEPTVAPTETPEPAAAPTETPSP